MFRIGKSGRLRQNARITISREGNLLEGERARGLRSKKCEKLYYWQSVVGERDKLGQDHSTPYPHTSHQYKYHFI